MAELSAGTNAKAKDKDSMSSELLQRYDYNTNSYRPFAGTDDWAEVAKLGDQGGYNWCDFNAFYSPSARRYFWHGDRGCSCNSWTDNVGRDSDFKNGDRQALLRAWETFAKENEYSIHTSDYLSGVTTIRNYDEPRP